MINLIRFHGSRLSGKKAVFLGLLLSFVLALFLEIGVFHFSYLTQSFGNYPETEIDLSSYDGWNGEALALLPENASVSFDNLSLPVRSVTVSMAGPSGVISGVVALCDEASAVKSAAAGSFSVNPGGQTHTFTVPLKSHGELTRLRLTVSD